MNDASLFVIACNVIMIIMLIFSFFGYIALNTMMTIRTMAEENNEGNVKKFTFDLGSTELRHSLCACLSTRTTDIFSSHPGGHLNLCHVHAVFFFISVIEELCNESINEKTNAESVAKISGDSNESKP